MSTQAPANVAPLAIRSRRATSEVLSRRALNRALLERQMLLRRWELPAADVITRLVGMQAQSPLAPYVGLWSRLANFQPSELALLLTERRVVRAPLMRTTIHLVTASDCLSLRPVLQPVLERGFYTGSPYGRNLTGMDVAAVLATGRALLEAQPRSTAMLGQLLGARWPDRDAVSLAHAVRYLLPLVQLPPRGVWGASGQAIWQTVEAWLGRALALDATADTLVLSYLAAFGPASVKDVQAWCWLPRLGEVIERLRPQLRTFRDEHGVELFDLPDAPRPDADTPAPPRFVPEYDNLLLSHTDRSRVITDEHRLRVFTKGAVLVDGFVCGSWKIARRRDTATLLIELLTPLAAQEQTALQEEGVRLLAFAASEASTHDIQYMATQ